LYFFVGPAVCEEFTNTLHGVL